MMRYYLAYGSNLNKQQMAWRCPDAVPVGTAWIDDYELLFKGSMSGAYLTIEQKKGSKVPVAVWAVNETDENALDAYEGFPSFYYKKNMTLDVKFYNGLTERTECFVYIMHENRQVAIPSRMYMTTCIQGYHDFDFDIDYLEQAFENSSRQGWHIVVGSNKRG